MAAFSYELARLARGNAPVVDTLLGLADLVFYAGLPPKIVITAGFRIKNDFGGGLFQWSSTEPKSNHDGGSIIDPTKLDQLVADVWPGTWFTPNTSGVGCWIRETDVLSIRYFGARGDGVIFDTPSIFAAMSSGIKLGKVVYVPSGVYLCQANVLKFDFVTSFSKQFCLYGEGISSVLKIGDSLVTSSAAKLISMTPRTDMELIEIRDIMLDHNARGSTPPPGQYDYQQAATLRCAPLRDLGSVKLLRYRSITIKDPAADGMNIQGSDSVETWVIDNCSEIDRTRTRSSIQMSYLPENTVITGFSGARVECEPVAPSLVPKNVVFSNSIVNILDVAGLGITHNMTWAVSNVVVKENMASGAARFLISNCDIKFAVSGRINRPSQDSIISDTIIRLHCDPSTGVVSGIDLRAYTSDGYVSGITFDNCRFLIDGAHSNPSGYLLKVGDAVLFELLENAKWNVKNCYFDPRAQGSVYCYRNGIWNLENNTYACAALEPHVAAIVHSPSNGLYGARVTVRGGDFSNVVGNGIAVSSAPAASDAGALILAGDMVGLAALRITTFSESGSADANDMFTRNTRKIHVDVLPSFGIYGDTVVVNSPRGWPKQYIATRTSLTGPMFRLVQQNGVHKAVTNGRPLLSEFDIGLMYLDTSLKNNGKPIWWTGTAWVDANGDTV